MSEKQSAIAAVEAGFSDSVRKAVCQLFDGMITAAGDAADEAGSRARYEAALVTFRRAHRVGLEVADAVFSE